MDAPYPSDEDRQALAAAHDALAAHGVLSKAGGYDLTSLAAAVYATGGTYGIDLAGGHYQAQVRPQRVTGRGAAIVAVGWAPEVALAFALARALAIGD